MYGQWIGPITGTTEGVAVVDLDEEGDHYRGHALYFPHDLSLPGTVAMIRTPDKTGTAELKGVQIAPLDRRGSVIQPGHMNVAYPNAVHGGQADIKMSLAEDGLLDVSYVTRFAHPELGELSTDGQGRLTFHDGSRPSGVEPLPEVTDWASFKDYVAGLNARRFIYRGQPCLNRLRTSFHRTRRSDLVRYVDEDVPLLHRHLTPQTQHLFNLSDPQQTGAFYNLMQHHGYPTPLLDWSTSPFISAFFAFRERTPPDQKVRVYIFDRETWVAKVQQFDRLTFLPPHLSVIELLGIENKRMIPQQALSTLTNIDDIETYIHFWEQQIGLQLLYAADLHASERAKVFNDLSLMGISSASLFPGFDGTCEALRGRMFGH